MPLDTENLEISDTLAAAEKTGRLAQRCEGPSVNSKNWVRLETSLASGLSQGCQVRSGLHDSL